MLLPQVVDSARKASFSYSTSVEQADVTAAYTRKPDGQRIEVPPGNDQVQVQSGQGDGAAAFSDQTTTTVIFPEVSEARVRVDMPAGMATRTREQKSELLRQHFQSMQLEGSGHITHDDPQAPLPSVRYQMTFEVQRAYDLPGPGALAIGPLLPNFKPMAHHVACAALAVEGTPLILCTGGRSVEAYTIEQSQRLNAQRELGEKPCATCAPSSCTNPPNANRTPHS